MTEKRFYTDWRDNLRVKKVFYGERMTEKRSCAYCKHLQIDGMFRLWCDIHDREWVNREYCSDYEKG